MAKKKTVRKPIDPDTTEELKIYHEEPMRTEEINQEELASDSLTPDEVDLPIEKALLLASCIAAIKDPMTGGPMDENNFNNCLPKFIRQAYTLYYNVLRTLEAAEKASK